MVPFQNALFIWLQWLPRLFSSSRIALYSSSSSTTLSDCDTCRVRERALSHWHNSSTTSQIGGPNAGNLRDLNSNQRLVDRQCHLAPLICLVANDGWCQSTLSNLGICSIPRHLLVVKPRVLGNNPIRQWIRWCFMPKLLRPSPPRLENLNTKSINWRLLPYIGTEKVSCVKVFSHPGIHRLIEYHMAIFNGGTPVPSSSH